MENQKEQHATLKDRATIEGFLDYLEEKRIIQEESIAHAKMFIPDYKREVQASPDKYIFNPYEKALISFLAHDYNRRRRQRKLPDDNSESIIIYLLSTVMFSGLAAYLEYNYADNSFIASSMIIIASAGIGVLVGAAYNQVKSKFN